VNRVRHQNFVTASPSSDSLSCLFVMA
jgi:hypothetical protein